MRWRRGTGSGAMMPCVLPSIAWRSLPLRCWIRPRPYQAAVWPSALASPRRAPGRPPAQRLPKNPPEENLRRYVGLRVLLLTVPTVSRGLSAVVNPKGDRTEPEATVAAYRPRIVAVELPRRIRDPHQPNRAIPRMPPGLPYDEPDMARVLALLEDLRLEPGEQVPRADLCGIEQPLPPVARAIRAGLFERPVDSITSTRGAATELRAQVGLLNELGPSLPKAEARSPRSAQCL